MKPYTLTNRAGESISPMTSTRTVFDENGVDLDTLLARQKSDTEAALKEYSKKTEVSQALADKQDALSTTTDLHITDDNIIGLTEAAKMKLFVDLWNEACGKWGGYNAETGFFELNGLTDIGYDEAVRIYQLCAGWCGNVASSSMASALSRDLRIRTALPICYAAGDIGLVLGGFAQNNSSIEVIRFVPAELNNMTSSLRYAFFRCTHLKHIFGSIFIRSTANLSNAFTDCTRLETVNLHHLASNLDIRRCGKISLESLRYMVDYSNVTNAITITVYKDIYAKLTDETNAEWYAVLVAAAEKNITFATV